MTSRFPSRNWEKKIDRHTGLSEHAANHAYQLNPGKSNILKDCINHIEGSYIPDIEQSQVFSINDDCKTVPTILKMNEYYLWEESRIVSYIMAFDDIALTSNIHVT